MPLAFDSPGKHSVRRRRTYSGLTLWAWYVDAGGSPFTWSAFCFCAGSLHVKARLSTLVSQADGMRRP